MCWFICGFGEGNDSNGAFGNGVSITRKKQQQMMCTVVEFQLKKHPFNI